MVNKSILITGGIGDFMALESFFTPEQRVMLEGIFYATRAVDSIQSLMKSLPNYPNLRNHVVLWRDFNHFFAFNNKEEVLSALGRAGGEDVASRGRRNRWLQLLSQTNDYSIQKKFHLTTLKPFSGSSFISHKLADVSRFNLKDYYVICPYSKDKRIGTRDFKRKDWTAAINIVKMLRSKGVVLNQGEEEVPPNPNLINLSNQTTLQESIEILKGSKGYIGIDSCLSVLAAQLFSPPNLIIKSVNGHCYNNKHIYYAPKTTFEFLNAELNFSSA